MLNIQENAWATNLVEGGKKFLQSHDVSHIYIMQTVYKIKIRPKYVNYEFVMALAVHEKASVFRDNAGAGK